VCEAEITLFIAYFSKSKSGSPLSSVYFLNDVPNLPDSCCINFSGSSSSSASTPASNGSSSNGLSSPPSLPKPPSSPDSASSNESSDSSSSEPPKAGSLCGASSFSLYLVSSFRFLSPKICFSISAFSLSVNFGPSPFFNFFLLNSEVFLSSSSSDNSTILSS